MSMINKEVSDFSVQAYQNGEFKTVTKEDILGKWSVFFFYPADFTFIFPIDFPSYIVYDDLCTRVIEYDGLNGIGAFILQRPGFVYHFSISSLTLCQGTFFHFIEN